MSSPRTAVITAVSGRREHLRRQQEGLRRSEHRVDHRVVVAMDEQPVDGLGPQDVLIRTPVQRKLQLARARNLGAEAAMGAGADLLIFLDVDCIPAPRLISRYLAAAGPARDTLLCGPVHYLGPPGPHGYDLDQLPLPTGHPARPVPADDQLLVGGDHALFWSLSFAVTSRRWTRIGGFDERYEGYGGEDTDFGQRAKLNDVDLTWVGGAWSFHQYHHVTSPPIQHLDDIIANGELFRDRWGWWPMQGWLDEFQRLGLIEWDADADRWRRASISP